MVGRKKVAGFVQAAERVVIDQPWAIDLRDTFHALYVTTILTTPVHHVDAVAHPAALVSAGLEMTRTDEPSRSVSGGFQTVDVSRNVEAHILPFDLDVASSFEVVKVAVVSLEPEASDVNIVPSVRSDDDGAPAFGHDLPVSPDDRLPLTLRRKTARSMEPVSLDVATLCQRRGRRCNQCNSSANY
jgi:hypothetical protein